MTTTIYGIKSCSTMKKAFEQLETLNVDYQFFDYKKQPISPEKINSWVAHFGLEKVLNKRGTTWRKLTDEQKEQANQDEEYAISLMVEFPSMIKRPIIEDLTQHILLCGYDEQAITNAFTSKH